MNFEFSDSDDEFTTFEPINKTSVLNFTSNNKSNKNIVVDILSEEESLYKHNGESITYNDYTQIHLVSVRRCKLDPISLCEVNPDKSFIFPNQWDPYTGERLGEDPYGPIYFDPNLLTHYFYTNRLRELWHEPVDDNTGYYDGYYGEGVGAGETFHIVGRGYHPEWYLFRLPLSECYLTKDNNNQFVTFGPKLTNEEVIKINNLVNRYSYKRQFGKNPPDLVKIKKYYDKAIEKNPDVYTEYDHIEEELDIEMLKAKINRNAVNILRKM